jgi:hypothetical protein
MIASRLACTLQMAHDRPDVAAPAPTETGGEDARVQQACNAR